METRKVLNLYFDIDGVLNNTPARENMGFHVDREKVWYIIELYYYAYLRLPTDSLQVNLSCISFWRRRGASIISLIHASCGVAIPFITEATIGNKCDCVPNALLIIDDQPGYYKEEQRSRVYSPNGTVGFTKTDLSNCKLFLDKQIAHELIS